MKLRIDPMGIIILGFFFYGLFSFVIQEAEAAPTDDPRFCGTPARDASGQIVRSSVVLREFEAAWPKPQDGRRWYMDHVIPLACGGCDAAFNVQWLHEQAWRDKSKWERKVYGGHGISPGCP